ncbi:hypothetical protein Runsl_0794 [Runella slithyformis DSM 19594]|uniref:Uncharacterized protein n=1 Tax=Runella slithyformis (strain ATCC 29530 / DSM 19594 / LMG 11500 / NCIMB 11436 / LSU 4) TaxID=761193 RepID=A0A7U4E4K3_RUNSL|nr:hypothetical protein Runsl_0794 [Runella slithyformis DSM 19594]
MPSLMSRDGVPQAVAIKRPPVYFNKGRRPLNSSHSRDASDCLLFYQ